jgi:hypothetical protein
MEIPFEIQQEIIIQYRFVKRIFILLPLVCKKWREFIFSLPFVLKLMKERFGFNKEFKYDNGMELKSYIKLILKYEHNMDTMKSIFSWAPPSIEKEHQIKAFRRSIFESVHNTIVIPFIVDDSIRVIATKAFSMLIRGYNILFCFSGREYSRKIMFIIKYMCKQYCGEASVISDNMIIEVNNGFCTSKLKIVDDYKEKYIKKYQVIINPNYNNDYKKLIDKKYFIANNSYNFSNEVKSKNITVKYYNYKPK